MTYEDMEHTVTDAVKGTSLEEPLQKLRERVGEMKLAERVSELDARTREAVEARPLVAIAAALTAGYLLGRLLARR